MQQLGDVHFPDAERIVVVLDNLNTHVRASLYKVFPPADAFRIAQKLEFHFTPRHGSWVNIAELEFSALHRQCLQDRRVPTREALADEVAAWVAARNADGVTIDGRFTPEDARGKLTSLYPTLPTDEPGPETSG